MEYPKLLAKLFVSGAMAKEDAVLEFSGMIWIAGVWMEYTCGRAAISISFKSTQPSALSNQPQKTAMKNHMFLQGAFVKMYYFAIEAQDAVGYTLTALRCGKKRSLKISSW